MWPALGYALTSKKMQKCYLLQVDAMELNDARQILVNQRWQLSVSRDMLRIDYLEIQWVAGLEEG